MVLSGSVTGFLALAVSAGTLRPWAPLHTAHVKETEASRWRIGGQRDDFETVRALSRCEVA